jgi:hypothetical protein
MTEQQRQALLLELLDRLNQQGYWAGPRYLQKAVYFLQHLLEVPTGLDFVMYMFAPFSFDLEDAVSALRAYYLVELRIRRDFFGAILWPTEQSKAYREHFSVTLKTYENQLAYVCRLIDKKGISELERVTTALFFTLRMGQEASVEARVKEIKDLHHHVRPEDALAAVREADRLLAEVKQLRMTTTAA